MKKLMLAACGAMVLVTVAGCYSRPHTRTVAYTTTTADYDVAYYDNAYGPYQSGYWSTDGYFYYRDASGRYYRDNDRRFRREAYSGGVRVRATTAPDPQVVYYNNSYGPYSGGYWSNDGYFYYRDTHGRHHRDDAGHFRRDPFPGGISVRATLAP